jgi:hypothetical protein
MTKLALTLALAMATIGVASADTPSPSPSPRPTPNPYRNLKFGTATLETSATGNVELLDGWVAVRRDGRGWHACVSFKNRDARTATSVLFEFPLVDRNGEVLERLRFDRRGTFTTGIDIRGWSSLEAWQSGSNRGYDENCDGKSLSMAAFSLMQARMATYRVLRVDYSDGTSWTPLGSP